MHEKLPGTRSAHGHARKLLTIATAAFCLVSLAPAHAKDGPRLNKDQVDHIMKVIEMQGTKVPVPPPIAAGLRLTPRQIAPTIRQATFEDADGVKHGFAELNDGSGYFLFRRSQKDGLSVFHCDREFNLVGAIHNFEANRFMELSDADASREWTSEIGQWSRVVTQRGAKAPVLPPAQAPAPSAAPAPAPASTK